MAYEYKSMAFMVCIYPSIYVPFPPQLYRGGCGKGKLRVGLFVAFSLLQVTSTPYLTSGTWRLIRWHLRNAELVVIFCQIFTHDTACVFKRLRLPLS